MVRRTGLTAGVLGAVVLVAGCGAGTTRVTGSVTYQGQAVTGGNVSVVAADGLNYGATIQDDGTFVLPAVPVGPCKIGVNSPGAPARPGGTSRPPVKGALPAGAPAPPAAPSGRGVSVPDRYLDPLTSGLTGEVKPGQPLKVAIP